MNRKHVPRVPLSCPANIYRSHATVSIVYRSLCNILGAHIVLIGKNKEFYKVIAEPDVNDEQTNANEGQGYFRAFVACATDYIWAD